MRAAVFHGVGLPLAIEQVADPEPKTGQILIEVSHCGICGSDLHMTERNGLAKAGAVLGHEFAGVVVEGGSGRFQSGTRVTALPLMPCWACSECKDGHLFHCTQPQLVGVTANGAYAQAVVVDERLVQPLPAGVSFEDGALVEPLAVGRRMVGLAEGLKDANILIQGGGPVGVAGLIFARLGGASRIIVSEINEARRAKALELGADGVIDPSKEDLAARAAALCGERPDIVFECVGRPGMFADAVASVRPRGQIVSAGASFQYDGFVPIDALVKEITIRFSAGYTLTDFDAITTAMAQGQIEGERLVTGRISLDVLPDTFESLRLPSGHCKVIVDLKA
ncbi:zinc-binding dehydrogenase [Novosphingobium aquimarinum]|uniref:zinc-binding dehydrogenase n=1 Tax=Novosphingobium aquimarinum TaxID=2682494 RepID=UPI0012EB7D34|nr:alcohol dehydrogenase catalytic domain-containing protein [Novosphingobium aquimarinum]